jgi:hypothetical protein
VRLRVTVTLNPEAVGVHATSLSGTNCYELYLDRSYFTQQRKETHVASSMVTEEYVSSLPDVLKLLKK